MNFTHKVVQPKILSPRLEMTIALGGLHKQAALLVKNIEAAQNIVKKLQPIPARASPAEGQNFPEAKEG